MYKNNPPPPTTFFPLSLIFLIVLKSWFCYQVNLIKSKDWETHSYFLLVKTCKERTEKLRRKYCEIPAYFLRSKFARNLQLQIHGRPGGGRPLMCKSSEQCNAYCIFRIAYYVLHIMQCSAMHIMQCIRVHPHKLCP